MNQVEIEKKLKEFEEQIRKNEIEKAKFDEKLKQHQKEQDEILENIRKFVPEFVIDDLVPSMKELEKQIANDIKEIEKTLKT